MGHVRRLEVEGLDMSEWLPRSDELEKLALSSAIAVGSEPYTIHLKPTTTGTLHSGILMQFYARFHMKQRQPH